MTYERWEEILKMITSDFDVIEQGEGEENEHEAYEFIEFKRDGMLIRLELEIHSRLLAAKSIYSKRAGSSVTEKREYDDSEKIYNMSAFLFDKEGNDWEEISTDMF